MPILLVESRSGFVLFFFHVILKQTKPARQRMAHVTKNRPPWEYEIVHDSPVPTIFHNNNITE